MATSRSSPVSARFDQFEVDLSCKELRKSGARVPVQEQPFQLLQLLLDAEGKVVTREQLRNALWSADTFVDFEHSVNVAIGKLRHVLGDSPDDPKFIETLPKQGYRFIVPVEWVPENSDREGLHIVEPAVLSESEPANPQAHPITRHWKLTATIAVVALAVVPSLVSLSHENSYLSRTRLGTLVRSIVLGRSTTTQPAVTERRLTANPEDAPVTSAVISPDGKYLAYTDRTGFYLKEIDNDETHPVPLPKGFEPIAESWFPDSAHLAVSWAEDPRKSAAIWEISIMGGTPRKLTDDGAFARVSPDGKNIAYLRDGIDRNEIWLMQADGGAAHRLVKGADEAAVFFSPVAWAADGLRVSYVRLTCHPHDRKETQIEVSDTRGGVARVLLSKPDIGLVLAWARDELIYSLREPAPNQDNHDLWRVRLDSRTGRPLDSGVRLTSGRGAVIELSVSGNPISLALRRSTFRPTEYIAELGTGGKWLSPLKPLTMDERGAFVYSWTPDSRSVIFVADHGGLNHIFKQATDNQPPELLVGGNDDLGNPRLSPDGSEVLFLQLPKRGGTSQNVRIMRAPVAGGPPKLAVEATWIWNQQCARLPSTLCIYSPKEPNQQRFFTFDPVTGAGAEIPAARIAKPGVGWSLSADGNYLATAEQAIGKDAAIRLFSIADGSTRTIQVPGWSVLSGIDWAPDSKSMWVGVQTLGGSPFGGMGACALLRIGLDGTIKRMRTESGVCFGYAIASPDGRRLALFGAKADSSNVWLLQNF
jgi:DNA-binding winged helix-turn-helix (wHTH) protein/Tol biopolymer transport system component